MRKLCAQMRPTRIQIEAAGAIVLVHTQTHTLARSHLVEVGRKARRVLHHLFNISATFGSCRVVLENQHQVGQIKARAELCMFVCVCVNKLLSRLRVSESARGQSEKIINSSSSFCHCSFNCKLIRANTHQNFAN